MSGENLIISDLVEESGLSQKAISASAGISHTYLAKVLRGDVKRPGKAKLASILFALNKNLYEINSVLRTYDYRPLMHYDVHEILTNNRRRSVDGSIRPQFDRIHFALFLTALEHTGGSRVMVKDRPSTLFFPEPAVLAQEFGVCSGEWQSVEERDAGEFAIELLAAVWAERRALLAEGLEQGALFENYVHRKGFEEAVRRLCDTSLATYSRELVVSGIQAVANLVSLAQKWPEQCLVAFTEHNPAFYFQLQAADSEHPKVVFTAFGALGGDSASGSVSLQGFSSEDQGVVNAFRNEVERCREWVCTAPAERVQKFTDTVRECFAPYGLVEQFDAELADLMRQEGFVLF